jgi:GNAT superfamily N-acetyltransferase
VDEIRGELGAILDEDPDDLTAFDHNGLVIMWGDPYGDGTIIWGALDGKKVVAGGNFTVRGDELWEGTQAVLPQYQRKGIYRAILGELREMYPMCKFQSDGSQSASMQALWRKLGARDTGTFYELPAMDNPRRRGRRNPPKARVVYHGSFFKHPGGCPTARTQAGPFGLHFGTLKSAVDRLEHIKKKDPSKGDSYIYKAVISPKKTLAGVQDAGLWNSARDVAYVLTKKLGSSDRDESVFGLRWYDLPFDGPKEERALAKMFKELRRRGYDAISYRNSYEDKGKVSYIILDRSIIQECDLDTSLPAGTKGNPSKEEFYRAGEFRRKLKAVQQDIYEKTGNWMELGEVAELVSKHSAMVARSQFQVVRSNPIRKPQTEAFRKWYGRSKVRGVVYHMTRSTKPFTKFAIGKSDLGAHFGTLDQAEYRAELFDEGAIMPVWLRIRHPLRLIDTGSFHADAIAPQLAKKGIIPKDVAKKIITECEANWRMRKKYDPMLRRLIQTAGYDGIVYKNQHEGAGDSWIAFDSRQIKSALANTGKFGRTSGSMINPDAPMFGSSKQVSWAKRIRSKMRPMLDALIDHWEHSQQYVRGSRRTVGGRWGRSPGHTAGLREYNFAKMVRDSSWAKWWIESRDWTIDDLRAYIERLASDDRGALELVHAAKTADQLEEAWRLHKSARGARRR